MNTYKHTLTFGLAAGSVLIAAIALLSACESGSIDGTEAAVSPRFSAGINKEAATRAIDQTWFKDTIGVIVAAAPNSDMESLYPNVPYATADSAETRADFTPVDTAIYFQEMTETVTFGAYAPYNEDGGSITVSDTRAANESGETESIDYIFAKATGSASKPSVNFTFDHIMTKLVLRFKAAGNQLSFSDLTDPDKTTFKIIGLSHSGTIDLNPGSSAFGSAIAKASTAEWDITSCKYTDGKSTDGEDMREYELIVFPQKPVGGDLLLLVTYGRNAYCSTSLQNSGTNLEPGKEVIYQITVNMDGASLSVDVNSVKVANWSAGGTVDLVTQ